jgi:hypothetical protein
MNINDFNKKTNRNLKYRSQNENIKQLNPSIPVNTHFNTASEFDFEYKLNK